jgi:hypothetical protein
VPKGFLPQGGEHEEGAERVEGKMTEGAGKLEGRGE